MSYQVQPLAPQIPVAVQSGNITSPFHRWLMGLLTLVRFSGVPQFGIIMHGLTAAEEAVYFVSNIGVTGTPWSGWILTAGQTITVEGVSRTVPNIASAAMRIS